jgi:anti-anti-sigma regulatory factor
MRITIDETAEATALKLEGRVVGPWAVELARTWTEIAPSMLSKKLSLDLSNVTFADTSGIQVLRSIYSQTGAQLLASTPWTQYLAGEVRKDSSDFVDGEA